MSDLYEIAERKCLNTKIEMHFLLGFGGVVMLFVWVFFVCFFAIPSFYFMFTSCLLHVYYTVAICKCSQPQDIADCATTSMRELLCILGSPKHFQICFHTVQTNRRQAVLKMSKLVHQYALLLLCILLCSVLPAGVCYSKFTTNVLRLS